MPCINAALGPVFTPPNDGHAQALQVQMTASCLQRAATQPKCLQH